MCRQAWESPTWSLCPPVLATVPNMAGSHGLKACATSSLSVPESAGRWDSLRQGESQLAVDCRWAVAVVALLCTSVTGASPLEQNVVGHVQHMQLAGVVAQLADLLGHLGSHAGGEGRAGQEPLLALLDGLLQTGRRSGCHSTSSAVLIQALQRSLAGTGQDCLGLQTCLVQLLALIGTQHILHVAPNVTM